MVQIRLPLPKTISVHTELNGSHAEKKSVLIVFIRKLDSERDSYFTCNDEVVGSSPTA